MWKKGTWIFLAFSAVFFLFLIGLTGYRIETVRERNTRQGGFDTAILTDRILALRNESGGFQAASFSKGMREESPKRPRFLLLCIRSTEGEVLYLSARNKSYLKRPDRISADWRGTPAYAVRPGMQESFSNPFQVDGRTLFLDGLYVVLSREDLYPILRDDLFLCLAFLMICGIVLLLSSAYPGAEHAVRSQSVHPRRQSPASVRVHEAAGPRPVRMTDAATAAVPVPSTDTAPEPDEILLDELPDMNPDAAPAAVPDAATAAVPDAATAAVPDAAPAAVPDAATAAVPDAATAAVPDAATAAVSDAATAAGCPPCPEPEEKTFFNPASGLVWHEYFLPRLRSEIERAASFDMDLSLCFVQADNRIAEDQRVQITAAYVDALKSTFPLRDLVFEMGSASFAIILPDTDIDQAVAALDNLRGKLEALQVAGTRLSASLGASSRGGRLIDEKSLLEEAEASLHKAHDEGGNQVVGFRADPMRFRETLNALGT